MSLEDLALSALDWLGMSHMMDLAIIGVGGFLLATAGYVAYRSLHHAISQVHDRMPNRRR